MTTDLSLPAADFSAPSVAASSGLLPGRIGRFARGHAEDPAWVRPGLLTLLGATALLYLWGLSASGWANSFYAAAAQAGSESWTAFLFGSSDAANSITVDKTPASLWVMSLSARLFGVNSWSLLVPQALMGVATVALVYLSVRRWYGPTAGLLAGAATALTPVAVLMFRFNNPDALLVLLLVGAAYAMQRAIESGTTRWVVLAGALIGFGFLAKMLQAVLVVPGFALVYLLVGPTPVRARIGQLLAGAAAIVVAAGWWVAIAELWPASARPYIGGSQNNSVLELVLGYNGLGRLNGEEVGSVGGGQGGDRWGETGWLRMFNPDNGGQVAWLIPAALILAGFGLWVTRHAPRTDRTRAGLLLWGSWLLVTMAVFSFMQGIYHAYYTVALAPAIGAVVAIGATLAWRNRQDPLARTVCAAAVAITAWWAARLLDRTPHFHSWIGPTVLVLGVLAAFACLVSALLGTRLAAVVGASAVIVALAGPAAYAVDTAGTAHHGSIPSAGPQVENAGPAGPGRGGPGRGFARGGQAGLGNPGPGDGAPTAPGGPTGGILTPGQGVPVQDGRGGAGGPSGGLLEGSDPGEAVTALLRGGADGYTWVAAAVGSHTASGYQLATGAPVMAIGGFNGSDPAPTLAQFQEYVAQGEIHYFIGGGGFGGPGGGQMGGSQASAEIAAWVAQTFPAQTVDSVTVYDLTGLGSAATTMT